MEGDILSKESTAAKKAQELNELAGYKRFTVIRTLLPGRGGATLAVHHGDEEFDEDETEEDLNHYGVLGMKWGVRKDPQRAYERANQKLTALDKRATKAGAKAARKETRSLRRQQRADTAWLFPKTKAKLADWAIGRSEKHRQKYVKKMSRAVSWYKEMENAFRDTKIENLNQDYVALGEKYSKIQVNDLMMNAQASLANKQLRMIYRQMGR